MAQKRNRDGYRSYDQEQPEGWFDPENYARNRDTYSNYDRQMTNRRFADTSSGEYDSNRRTSQYGRADYTEGQDPHSGFPSYRNVPGQTRRDTRNYNSGTDTNRYERRDNDVNTRKSYMYGDNFEQPVRYKNERSYENRNENRNTNRWRQNDDSDWQEDRNWLDRTSDEIASWFGDDDAERRRRLDKIRGPHHGKGPKGYSRTDEKIMEDINDRLYHDSYIDASEIEVAVTNGDVVLTGTVENKMIKRRVEDIAEGVSGVKDVENHLKVNRTSSDINYTTDRDRFSKDGEGRSWS